MYCVYKSEMNRYEELYLTATFIMSACISILTGVVLWALLALPWCLYRLVLATFSNGYEVLWSNGLKRIFSK